MTENTGDFKQNIIFYYQIIQKNNIMRKYNFLPVEKNGAMAVTVQQSVRVSQYSRREVQQSEHTSQLQIKDLTRRDLCNFCVAGVFSVPERSLQAVFMSASCRRSESFVFFFLNLWQ